MNDKKKEGALVTEQESLDSQIKQSLAKGKLGDRNAQKRKKIIRIFAIFAGVLFLYWAYIALFTYPKGGMKFGVCKVFLELQVQYPRELRLSYVEPFSKFTRIWYVQHDAYGQSRFDAMDCYYKEDGSGLDRVEINRRQVDPVTIEKFNASIPAILAYPPDLTYPVGLPDNVKELKTDQPPQ
jgi:hypothetical protein